MSLRKRVSEVIIGGSAANNPVPLSTANYQFTATELTYVYLPINVKAFHKIYKVYFEVTAMARVDVDGGMMLNPTDYLYMPCPPFCQSGA